MGQTMQIAMGYVFIDSQCIYEGVLPYAGMFSHHLKVFYLNNANEDGSACGISLSAVQTPLELFRRAWAETLQQRPLLITLLMTLSRRYSCTSLLQISFLLVKVV